MESENTTDTKQMAGPLGEQEEFNRALFDHNPVQTIVVDRDGKITDYNLAKIKSGDRLPNPGDVMFKDYAGKYDIDMHTELMECIKSGQIKEFPEQRYENKFLSTTVSPFAEGAIIITKDITARNIAEEKLRRANEQLKEQDKLRTEFVSTVSHELRTSLCVFKNIVSNVIAGGMGKVSRKLCENLQMADQEFDRLAQIIGDFLDISKIKTGRMELSPSVFSMQSLVCKVVNSQIRAATAKNIELRPGLPDCELFVNADRNRIAQVLTNLIDNAIKFTPDVGGRVDVFVKEHNEEVWVEVKDNGSGIEPDEIEKVFNCFVRLEKHLRLNKHSTGLGLTVAKELIEMHGGRICVESTPEVGSSFYFVLPKYSGQAKNQVQNKDEPQQLLTDNGVIR